MRTDLRAFLRDLARKPFIYGQTDCGLPLADLWLAEHGVDPAADLRGTYRSQEDCMRLLGKSAKHLPGLVARLAYRMGASRRWDNYQPGDMAVLRIGRIWFGAIRDEDGFWVVKESDGVLAMREAHVVAAWSLC